MVYTVPFNSSVDGNTVELSVEQAKYGKAAAVSGYAQIS